MVDRHASQIKRQRQDLKRHAVNVKNMSRLRSAIKKVLMTKKLKEAEAFYNETVSLIDKMAANGLIHKNTAARRKAQIARHLNSLK
ncbi:MAG: 30S ribosomal protein S20 [Candidatus Marinimicrobia bacterium]|nr:30S ribosomal protein S20 [Candidatus Neomarinimicrobiota bacterium]